MMNRRDIIGEAFDNPRRTTDTRTTKAPDFKPVPTGSRWSNTQYYINPEYQRSQISSVNFVPSPPTPSNPKPRIRIPTTKPKTRQTTLRLNVPKTPKTKVEKPNPSKETKKPKSRYRQLSLKLKESQLFLESYYRSLDRSK
jgi:hypothetical protein